MTNDQLQRELAVAKLKLGMAHEDLQSSKLDNVWILSEGEKYEGEHVVAVYSNYDAARKALEALANDAGADVRIDGNGDVESFQDGCFYSIIRNKEVQS